MNNPINSDSKEITALEQAQAEIERLKDSAKYYQDLYYKEIRKTEVLSAAIKALAQAL